MRPAPRWIRHFLLAALASLALVACVPPQPAAEATRMPFQRDVSIDVPAGSLTANANVNVPPGQRLVLEYISGSVRVAGEELVRVNVVTAVDGQTVQHTLANQTYQRDFDPPIPADRILTWGQPLKLYADPGSTVTIVATRSENQEITPTRFDLGLSGYLLECGSGPGCPLR